MKYMIMTILALVCIVSLNACGDKSPKPKKTFVSTKCEMVCTNTECNQVCASVGGTLK